MQLLLTRRRSRFTQKRAISAIRAIEAYQVAIQSVPPDTTIPLSVLLQRDEVAKLLEEKPALSEMNARLLIRLDEALRTRLSQTPPADLCTWRRSVQPHQTSWWWFEQTDEAQSRKRRERNDRWIIAVSTLMSVITFTLSVAIFQRVWLGGTELLGTFLPIITALLAVGTLVERVQSFVASLLADIPGIPSLRRTVSVLLFSAMALIITVTLFVWGLPGVARWYNARGIALTREAKVTAATTYFQQAVALDPDVNIPYLNLGETFVRMGRLDEAQVWLEQAINTNADRRLAYSRLGEVLNLKGQYSKASFILLAGLNRDASDDNSETSIVEQYELLMNAGWSYFNLGDPLMAQSFLEDALQIEDRVKVIEDKEEDPTKRPKIRSPRLHFYLGKVYESQHNTADALLQYDTAISLIDLTNSWHRPLLEESRERIYVLRSISGVSN